MKLYYADLDLSSFEMRALGSMHFEIYLVNNCHGKHELRARCKTVTKSICRFGFLFTIFAIYMKEEVGYYD